MFKKKLRDLHAEIELPRPFFIRNLEDLAGFLDGEAKDLTNFIGDHRSRDSYQINIIRDYDSVCEYCGYMEERDVDGTPVCCEKAIAEHQASVATPR